MQTQAVAKFIRITPRKARYAADMIRGKQVEHALNTLKFTPRASSRIMEKVLRSAVANAGQLEEFEIDKSFVTNIFVNAGPVLKRIQPRAMGRAYRIKKRTCHITVVISDARPAKQK